MSRRPQREPRTGTNLTTGEWSLQILERVRAGELSPVEAVQELRILPCEGLLCAKPDHHRSLRLGFPEVTSGEGKG